MCLCENRQIILILILLWVGTVKPSVPYCSGITGNGNPNLTLDFTDRKVNKEISNILLGNQRNSISLSSIPPSAILSCLTEKGLGIMLTSNVFASNCLKFCCYEKELAILTEKLRLPFQLWYDGKEPQGTKIPQRFCNVNVISSHWITSAFRICDSLWCKMLMNFPCMDTATIQMLSWMFFYFPYQAAQCIP